MSTPVGDNSFLYELELGIRTDLAVAETSQPEEQADGGPTVEWLSDPDAQRYVVALRTLLGAVESLEDGFCLGGRPPRAETPDSGMTAGHAPDGPGPGTSRACAREVAGAPSHPHVIPWAAGDHPGPGGWPTCPGRPQ